MVSYEVAKFCNEVIKFMNNDLDTRDFTNHYDDDLIKTFNEECGNVILKISLTNNRPDMGCYWFDYNRVWWKKQTATDLEFIKKMVFQLNNKHISLIVFIHSTLSGGGVTMFNNTDMKIEYINCVFNKGINSNQNAYETIIFTNCEFMGDSK